MKRLIPALLVVVILLSASVAFATDLMYFGTFTFNNVTTTEDTNPRAKGDYETNWYLTLLSPSNVSSSNVLGVRPRFYSGGGSAGPYRTVKSNVTSARYAYDSGAVTMGDSIFLRMKKDDSSSTSTALKAYGRFTP